MRARVGLGERRGVVSRRPPSPPPRPRPWRRLHLGDLALGEHAGDHALEPRLARTRLGGPPLVAGQKDYGEAHLLRRSTAAREVVLTGSATAAGAGQGAVDRRIDRGLSLPGDLSAVSRGARRRSRISAISAALPTAGRSLRRRPRRRGRSSIGSPFDRASARPLSSRAWRTMAFAPAVLEEASSEATRRAGRRPTRAAGAWTTSVTAAGPRYRPVLSEPTCGDVAGALERFASLDEQAELGAAAGCHHHRRGHGEPHGARAGDDEDGDRRREGAHTRAPPVGGEEPETKVMTERQHQPARNTALMRSARRWIGPASLASRMSCTMLSRTLSPPRARAR